VIHDETVDRMTNGHGYVKDLTFSELRMLDAGKGEKIPTLEETLKLTMGKATLQVELKSPEAVEPTIHLIERYKAEGEVVLLSFMHELLRKVHVLNPALRTGVLFFDVQGDICQRALDVRSEAIHVYYQNMT